MIPIAVVLTIICIYSIVMAKYEIVTNKCLWCGKKIAMGQPFAIVDVEDTRITRYVHSPCCLDELYEFALAKGEPIEIEYESIH